MGGVRHPIHQAVEGQPSLAPRGPVGRRSIESMRAEAPQEDAKNKKLEKISVAELYRRPPGEGGPAPASVYVPRQGALLPGDVPVTVAGRGKEKPNAEGTVLADRYTEYDSSRPPDLFNAPTRHRVHKPTQTLKIGNFLPVCVIFTCTGKNYIYM